MTFVASVLLPATQTPLEYPRELHTGKGALAIGSLDATTDHVPVIALGRDDIAKTFVPRPPTIQRGAPVPCDPARPYATVSADVKKGVYVEMIELYTNVRVVFPLTVSVPWTVMGARVNGGTAACVAVIVVTPSEMSLIRRSALPYMLATAGLLLV